MCNQEIKFKLFLETAIEDGADLVATGHYARVQDGKLFKAEDDNKDQTYFLYRVNEEALRKTLFPLGELTKPEVRKLAKKYGLVTAAKKESMGICFVGKVGIKEFLLHELGPQPHGKIIDQNGKVLGEHDGAIFYTIGQRHGLGVGAGLPYYVVGKDMAKNEVYVTTQIDDKRLWNKQLNLTDLHWINGAPKSNQKVQVRTRHRAAMIEASIKEIKNNIFELELTDDIRALTPGQSAVLCDQSHVLGGGIIV